MVRKTKRKTRKTRKPRKTRKVTGISRCPNCMNSGREVRVALETKNLIKAIKKSPFISLLTIGKEILAIPTFKKQKAYINELEKTLCKKLKKINIKC